MQTDRKNPNKLRRLSPKGNHLWCNMVEDNTLMEPLIDMEMENLGDYTMNIFRSEET
jgi:hypothetical protein